MTIAIAKTAKTGNQPLPYTKQAIKDHLAYQATHGPAYVQFQATNAMARIMGLYEEGTLSVRQAFKDAQDAIKAAVETVKDRVGGGKKVRLRARGGTPERRASDQGGAARGSGSSSRTRTTRTDEEGGKRDEDEPP